MYLDVSMYWAKQIVLIVLQQNKDDKLKKI